MKVLNLALSSCCLLSIVPLVAQERSRSRPAIAELRKALLGNLAEGSDLEASLEQVREAIRGEIALYLNSSSAPSTSEMKEQISDIVQEGQPSSVLRKRFNGADFVVVGYSIAHGAAATPDSTPVIEAFRRIGNSFQPVAHTGDRLERSRTRLNELPSPWPNELWILAHGQQSRTMQYHEKMAIYSFDGSQFKELWASTEGRRDASYLITDDSLFVNYDDDSDWNHVWLTQRLYLTPGGVIETTPQLQVGEWKVRSGTVERSNK